MYFTRKNYLQGAACCGWGRGGGICKKTDLSLSVSRASQEIIRK
jgi:hypothetical protein